MTSPRPTRAALAALACLLAGTLVTGCGASAEPAPASSRSDSATVAAGAAPAPAPAPVRLTPEQLVDDPAATLTAAAVDGSTVATVWTRCRARGAGCRSVVARSDDGFATATYAEATEQERSSLQTPLPVVPDGVGLDDLLVLPVVSFDAGVRAAIGGADGATLMPFARVARTRDGGASWAAVDVSWPDDVVAFVTGAVVRGDGSLLTLLPSWSDESLERLGPRHHGLWLSDGADWSSYTPAELPFAPPLSEEPRGHSPLTSLVAEAGDAVWATTWDSRLYVSRDGALSFTEVAAR